MASGAAEPITYRRGEIGALTGLRFIAAAAVVIHHIGAPRGSPDWLRQLVSHGFIGVPLFFMLSGVVLGWNYPTLRPSDGRGVLRFYIARLARVMPLYWLVLLYLITLRQVRHVPQYEVWRHVIGIETWSGDYTRVAYAYNAPAWSVNVELFLYLIFPLLVPVVAWLARRGQAPLLALIAACMAIEWLLVFIWQAKGWAYLGPTEPNSAHRWLYRNPLTRVPEFVIGLCLAFILHRGAVVRRWVATSVQVSVIGYVLLLAHWPSTQFHRLVGAQFGPLWSLPFLLLLFTLAAAPDAPLSRFLASRPMLALGTASYALYLTHRPLIAGLGAQYSRLTGGPTGWLLAAWVLLLAMFVAEGAHRYVEVPARRAIVGWSRRVLGTGGRPAMVEEAAVTGHVGELAARPDRDPAGTQAGVR